MKIIVTGDILRPDDNRSSHQMSNIKWFYDLMNWQLAQAVKNADIRILLWDGGKNSFDAKSFYASNNLDISTESWAKLFSADVETLTVPSIEYFRTFFDGDVAVIGFELPDVFIKLFTKFGINFIDFIAHPVRFLDDIFFGIRTNNAGVFDLLKKFAIKEEQFYIQANIHKATISRIQQPELEENSCLLVGQTKADRSLICNGTILTLLDYIEQLDEISRRCSKIYLKPHPHAWKQDEATTAVQKKPYVEIIHENIYKLLCHESIKEVWSVSSSVVYESRFFGKRSNYLYKNSINLYSTKNSEFSPWIAVPIYDEFYNPLFWSDIMGTFCEVNRCIAVTLPRKTSRLRITCQTYWGYNFLDFDLLYRSIEPNVIKAVSEIAYGGNIRDVKNLRSKIHKGNCLYEIFRFLKGILKKIKRYLARAIR